LSFRGGKNTRFTSGVELNVAGKFTGLGWARQAEMRRGTGWSDYEDSLAAKVGLGAGAILGAEATVDVRGYVNCLAEEAAHGR
jgi:hypothetical protein